MGIKKKEVAKLFEVSILTVHNWDKSGKILKSNDGIDIKSLLSMAKDELQKLKNKEKIIKSAIDVLNFEAKQEKIYFENLEKYNKAMGI